MEISAITISNPVVHQHMAVGLSGEIISRSQIGDDFSWPEEDPRLLYQNVRLYGAEDDVRVMEASESCHFNMADFLEKTKNLGTASRIIELLNHNAFQFNSRKRFRECELWRTLVEKACEQSIPIEILILAFCVISNPTKRVHPTVVTTAEDVSLLHIHRIAQHIQLIYPPGAVFQVISDSTFYALPLGVTSVEAQNYLALLKQRTQYLNIDDTIKVHDISDYLADQNNYFHSRFEYWRSRFLDNPLSSDLDENEYRRWLVSMRATLNSRRMGFNYQQLRSLFCADAETSYTLLDECAKTALAEYRALKSAAADTKWEAHHFPNAVRATIHAKKLPVLGLRLYPEYKIASRLLPYHGIAVMTMDEESEIEQMDIRHEITVIGNPAYTKVISQDNVTQFYEACKS